MRGVGMGLKGLPHSRPAPETCGNRSHLTTPGLPPLAGARYPARSLGASAVAAPQGLQGEPRLRRLLSSLSLRLRLPRPGYAPSTGAGRGNPKPVEEPNRPGARGTELERGPPGGSTRPPSRSSRCQLRGPQTAHREAPFSDCCTACPPPFVLDDSGKVFHHHKDHQLLVEKQVPHRNPKGPREPSGDYFLASVSPMTPGKASCHWSRPGGQRPASPGRPLAAQPLLPLAPAPLPRSQRWAEGPG